MLSIMYALAITCNPCRHKPAFNGAVTLVNSRDACPQMLDTGCIAFDHTCGGNTWGMAVLSHVPSTVHTFTIYVHPRQTLVHIRRNIFNLFPRHAARVRSIHRPLGALTAKITIEHYACALPGRYKWPPSESVDTLLTQYTSVTPPKARTVSTTTAKIFTVVLICMYALVAMLILSRL